MKRFTEQPAVIIPPGKLAQAAALPYIRARGGAENFQPLYATAAGTGAIRGYLLAIPMTPGLRDQLRGMMLPMVVKAAHWDESGEVTGRVDRVLSREKLFRKLTVAKAT